MRRAFSLLTGLTLAACQVPQSTRQTPPRSPSQAPIEAPAALEPSTHPEVTLVPAAPPTPPPALSVVVEGQCPDLGVTFFKNATLVHYGSVPSVYYSEPYLPAPATTHLAFALVRADGSLDEDPKLRRGIPQVSEAYAGGGAGTEPLDVAGVSGTWPDDAHLALVAASGNRMGTESFDFTWKADHWLQVSRGTLEDRELKTPWLSGSTLTRRASDSPYPELVVVPAGATPTPDFTALHVPKAPMCNFMESDILTRPRGELFLAGKFCGIYPTHEHPEWRGDGPHPPVWQGEAGVARWTPGSPATIMAIPPVSNHADLELHGLLEASPTSMFLFGTVDRHANATCATCAPGAKITPEAYLALYDGSTWSRIQTPYEGFVWRHEIEADGTLWISDSAHHLYRRAPEGVWTKEPVEAVTSEAWQSHRPEWVISAGALMHHGKYDEWTRFETPRPAFSSSSDLALRSVSLSSDGVLWVKASYEERRPEWTTPERREALLRLGVEHAPTRCDVDTGPSFSAWPPRATEGCEDPLVILAHVSKSAPATFGFPQTRAALRGHPELAGTGLVEIELDGKRLLAAKVKSTAIGQHVVDVVGHRVRGVRPELVCTKPNVTRTIAVDVAAK